MCTCWHWKYNRRCIFFYNFHPSYYSNTKLDRNSYMFFDKVLFPWMIMILQTLPDTLSYKGVILCVWYSYMYLMLLFIYHKNYNFDTSSIWKIYSSWIIFCLSRPSGKLRVSFYLPKDSRQYMSMRGFTVY